MSEFRDITIPGAVGNNPGIFTEDVGDATVLHCVDASDTFQVRPLGGGSKLEVTKGRGFGSPKGKPFGKVTFFNISGTPVVATVYIGREEFKDASVPNVVLSAVTNSISNCIAAIPAQFLKTHNTGAASALTGAQTYFRKAVVIAKKTLAGTTLNAGNVYLGFSSATNEQLIELEPGGEYVFEPPSGAKWNFQNLYLKVLTNGDGVIVYYT